METASYHYLVKYRCLHLFQGRIINRKKLNCDRYVSSDLFINGLLQGLELTRFKGWGV